MEPSYRYKAFVNKVVDGDTIDVTLDLGFYVGAKERLRLQGINTPEIFRVPKESEEYEKGMEAKSYIERRLVENGGEMVVETKKRGKWRRWLAKVYLGDSEKALNEELVEKGLAEVSKY
jgi:micrococcal nuclease